MKNKTVVISDIHIGDDSDTCWYRKEVHEPYLTAVLQWVIKNKDDIRELIILGDLVDFWTYPPDRVPPTIDDIIAANPNTLGPKGIFTDVLNALKGSVSYLNGNHDMSLEQKHLNKIGGPQYKITKKDDVYFNNGVLYTHGHLDTLFNAPDKHPGQLFDPLPAGHFVTRALSYMIQQKLAQKKAGKITGDWRAVDLPAQGANVIKDNKSKIIKEYLLHGDKQGIAGSFLAGVGQDTGLGLDENIKLAGGETTTLSKAIANYKLLVAEWWSDNGGDEDALLTVYKAARADIDGSYLGWFAQRKAMNALDSLKPPYLVVMGHTHVPKLGLHNAVTDYLNTGFFCPSLDDMNNGQHVTFGVIEHNFNPEFETISDNKKYLYRVTDGGKKIELHTAGDAEIASAIFDEKFSGDFSSYIQLGNLSNYTLERVGLTAEHGHYVVPPPASIAPNQKTIFWLQDYPVEDKTKVMGSAGSVTYRIRETGRLYPLKFACPAWFRYDNVASGGDKIYTKSGDQKRFSDEVVTDGHPFFVDYTVEGWTPWYGNPDAENTFFVRIPDDAYLVGVQVGDQGGHGIVNMRFWGTKDINATRTKDFQIMPRIGSGVDGWVSGNRNADNLIPLDPGYIRARKGTYIDALMFSDKNSFGIVNVKLHYSDGTDSGWLTQNEPVRQESFDGYFPPKGDKDTWDHAIKGRIRQIEIRRKDDQEFIDFRYLV